ncbi:myo-inositol-1-phosphate synthase [Nocardioides sp. dk4132]|uniref:inositol-3-phosphate synthase n=1 Tax=unclassified Nocardioides TaxID=2615069 RepID=UPI001295DB2D|nr:MULTISPECIES: inositol-3-phosphate synthase [unclassified Nocardioides]MQW74977.1 myo-inositol-1-phosphate synthase [Nocardioides sp. dk4132]QGA07839.1 myo-inositol-1-phosphate synthase [Nocardioides sp. dk884]
MTSDQSSTHDRPARTGVWFVGAHGSVATTAVVGALGMRHGLAPTTGMVTELPELGSEGLPALDSLVFGGHDVVSPSLAKKAEALASGGVLPAALVGAVAAELAAIDADVRPGYVAGEEPVAVAVRRLAADLVAFREHHDLARVVVVDVASTQPPVADPESLRSLEDPLPGAAVYALAAFEAGVSYVAFTPSPCLRLPVVVEAAARSGLPYAGCDGKTGETLVKSALAPMFAARALELRSWASVNLLGGGDGATLADPETARSKTSAKRSGLDAMVGHPVPGPMHIDQIEDLGEWKTAWDHVRFDGFLGTRMTLQFTWQGCDSALAAPLVLDLARLVSAAHAAGRSGALPELAFFFKDPVGGTEHRLAEQWRDLVAWRQGLDR